jgi:hypothetical protein
MLHAVKVILASTVAFMFMGFVIICIDAGWTLVFYDKYQAIYELEMLRENVAEMFFFSGSVGCFIAIMMLVRGDW